MTFNTRTIIIKDVYCGIMSSSSSSSSHSGGNKLPKEICNSLDLFQSSLSSLKTEINKAARNAPTSASRPTTTKNKDVEITQYQHSKLINAKTNTMMAWSLLSMFWMWLRVQGVDPAHHPVKDVLDKVKKKIKFS